MIVLAVLLLAVASACTEPVPAFRMVTQQGMVRSIVVDEKVATNDAALLKIADSLLPKMPGRAVMLQVWTDARMVPRKIMEMTDAQAAARRAVVTINLNSGYRAVDR